MEGDLGAGGDGGEPKRSRALVEAGEVGFERLGGEAEEGLVGGEFGVLGEFALEFGWKFIETCQQYP